MDFFLTLLNAIACGLIALLMIGMILSPRVHDGVVIKTGLSTMVLGFCGIAAAFSDGVPVGDAIALSRALLMVNIGIAVVIAGYLYRAFRAGHPVRRWADWINRPSKETTP